MSCDKTYRAYGFFRVPPMRISVAPGTVVCVRPVAFRVKRFSTDFFSFPRLLYPHSFASTITSTPVYEAVTSDPPFESSLRSNKKNLPSVLAAIRPTIENTIHVKKKKSDYISNFNKTFLSITFVSFCTAYFQIYDVDYRTNTSRFPVIG